MLNVHQLVSEVVSLLFELFLAVDICLLLLLENKTDERVNVKIRKPKDAPRRTHSRLTRCPPKYTSLCSCKTSNLD